MSDTFFYELPELAVIGWPLSKTFSPVMQNAALKKLNIPWKYEAIPVPQERIKEFFKTASLRMVGFNVTMPYKGEAYKMCAFTDDFAKKSGSVNTVVFEKNNGNVIIHGYNTDAPGLLRSLSERAGENFRANSAVIFGAGGAAAGCAAALASSGTVTITIVNRNTEKAKGMAESLRENFNNVDFRVLSVGEKSEIMKALTYSELIVSCIPEEGAIFYEAFLDIEGAEKKVYCDLSYGENPGRLFTKALKNGFMTVSGLDILLWQGVFAFEIFTGQKAPVEVMKKALLEKTGSWWSKC